MNQAGFISAGAAKLIIALAVFGVVAFDAGSIVVNSFTLDSTADDIAREVSVPFGQVGFVDLNPLEVRTKARNLARDSGAKLVKAEIDRENNVYIRVRRTANTLLVSRIDPIEDWGKATAEARVSGQ